MWNSKNHLLDHLDLQLDADVNIDFLSNSATKRRIFDQPNNKLKLRKHRQNENSTNEIEILKIQNT